jgi:hypothetical protein
VRCGFEILIWIVLCFSKCAYCLTMKSVYIIKLLEATHPEIELLNGSVRWDSHFSWCGCWCPNSGCWEVCVLTQQDSWGITRGEPLNGTWHDEEVEFQITESLDSGMSVGRICCWGVRRNIPWSIRRMLGGGGVHVVALLAEALCCKPEGRGFDSLWGHWIFQLT